MGCTFAIAPALCILPHCVVLARKPLCPALANMSLTHAADLMLLLTIEKVVEVPSIVVATVVPATGKVVEVPPIIVVATVVPATDLIVVLVIMPLIGVMAISMTVMVNMPCSMTVVVIMAFSMTVVVMMPFSMAVVVMMPAITVTNAELADAPILLIWATCAAITITTVWRKLHFLVTLLCSIG